MSLDLLSVLADRENYERFSRFVKPETLSTEVKTIVTDLGMYYKDNPSINEIDWGLFKDWFCIVQHSTYKSDKISMYVAIIDKMEEHIATDLAEAIITKYVGQDYAQQIADIALRAAEGAPLDLASIEEIIGDYNGECDRVNKLDEFIVDDDITALYEEAVTSGFKWRMSFLNKATGNARPGKLIVMAMRPNTGKTTLLASEATYMASQMAEDECVLWFNNEEAGTDVKRRIIQAALQLPFEKLSADPVKTGAAYQKAINGPLGKIKVIDKADINVQDVEEFARKYNAKLIIFDQLWKVKGFEKTSSTETSRLGNIFQWARELAKKNHCPVITSHQVKTEGEGVEYLTPSMLYLSGTVIQGEADTLVLVGRNYDPGQEFTRFFYIGKNKGAYGPEVDLSLAEGRCVAKLVPELAKWEEPK